MGQNMSNMLSIITDVAEPHSAKVSLRGNVAAKTRTAARRRVGGAAAESKFSGAAAESNGACGNAAAATRIFRGRLRGGEKRVSESSQRVGRPQQTHATAFGNALRIQTTTDNEPPTAPGHARHGTGQGAQDGGLPRVARRGGPRGPRAPRTFAARTCPQTSRDDAAASTWTFDESRRGRGCDVDIPWRRVATPPRPRREYSVETGRDDAAAVT